MWLGEARGHLVDWTTQRWVQATGRRTSIAEVPWLDGPAGKTTGIGAEFFGVFARERGLVMRADATCGLLPRFDALRSSACDTARVAPEVVAFYEHTSEYELDAWSEWCGPYRPFGRALAALFSRRLEQLNVPLSPLDTSLGMQSTVASLADPVTGRHEFTAWTRRLLGTGRVIYAGAYSTCTPPACDGPCVRVVFPLPNGNAVVIMRPEVTAAGGLTLVSAGRGFGSPGFYFTVHGRGGVVWARYLKALRETIRVFPAEAGGIRADHVLSLGRGTFLRIHYRGRRREGADVKKRTFSL